MKILISDLTCEERTQAGALWHALMMANCERELESACLDALRSPLPIQKAIKEALATPPIFRQEYLSLAYKQEFCDNPRPHDWDAV